jgi:glyoxylase-like metal-dependent hydrolase (beta-lactamase superfamily II)
MNACPYTKGAHQIGRGVYAWLQPDGSWGLNNAGLVVSQGEGLLVDTLFDLPLTREMLAGYQEAAGPNLRFTTLVCTHGNGDHTFGNELVPGAAVIGSRKCAEEMRETPPEMLASLLAAAPRLGDLGRYFQAAFGRFQFQGIRLRPPTVFVEDPLALDIAGRRVVSVLSAPAHTGGDVIVHVPDAGVVFAGDILFVGGMPIMWAGPMSNWIAACDTILSFDPETVVPGHGPVVGQDGVRRCREILETLHGEAKKRHEAGMSAPEAARDMANTCSMGLADPERVVITVHALYREFNPALSASGVPDLFAEMAAIYYAR